MTQALDVNSAACCTSGVRYTRVSQLEMLVLPTRTSEHRSLQVQTLAAITVDEASVPQWCSDPA